MNLAAWSLHLQCMKQSVWSKRVGDHELSQSHPKGYKSSPEGCGFGWCDNNKETLIYPLPLILLNCLWYCAFSFKTVCLDVSQHWRESCKSIMAWRFIIQIFFVWKFDVFFFNQKLDIIVYSCFTHLDFLIENALFYYDRGFLSGPVCWLHLWDRMQLSGTAE